MRDKYSGLLLCLKSYERASLSPLVEQQVLQEIDIHSRIFHVNILEFVAAWYENGFYYLLLEYASAVSFFDTFPCKNIGM